MIPAMFSAALAAQLLAPSTASLPALRASQPAQSQGTAAAPPPQAA